MPKRNTQGKEKTRNGGEWTEARYKGFIKSALRQASVKWPPINRTRKAAWVSRGRYKCAGCKKIVPLTWQKKKNVYVDHIKPVVPVKGWDSWDKVIERLFCEENNLQVLCKTCHDKKSLKERKERAKHDRTRNR